MIRTQIRQLGQEKEGFDKDRRSDIDEAKIFF